MNKKKLKYLQLLLGTIQNPDIQGLKLVTGFRYKPIISWKFF